MSTTVYCPPSVLGRVHRVWCEAEVGTESPLEFDSEGYAVVEDDEAATRLVSSRPPVEYAEVDPSEVGADDDEEDEDEEFDAEAFVDRTPVSDVVDDIESGEYDDRLDEILVAEQENRDRKTVQDAVEERR